MKLTLDLIQKLRSETGRSLLDCKQAIKYGSNIKEAKKYLNKKGEILVQRI